MTTDRQGGTTYTYANLNAFLANTLQQVQYLGDVNAPSPFNNGATGPRHTAQEYYIGYVQDEWRLREHMTMNLGVRYEYYTPMRERDNLLVKYNVDTGTIDSSATPLFKSTKTNLLPRVSMAVSPSDRTVLRGGFGIYVGPGQTEDQVQPIESDRVSSTITGGSYPLNIPVTIANFANNPNHRSFQPRAYTNRYQIPERVYSYTTSLQQQLPESTPLAAAHPAMCGGRT